MTQTHTQTNILKDIPIRKQKCKDTDILIHKLTQKHRRIHRQTDADTASWPKPSHNLRDPNSPQIPYENRAHESIPPSPSPFPLFHEPQNLNPAPGFLSARRLFKVIQAVHDCYPREGLFSARPLVARKSNHRGLYKAV